MSSDARGFLETVLEEILRDGHRYAPGVDPNLAGNAAAAPRRAAIRERSRDLLERAAARARFSHRHFDPRTAAQRLERIIALSESLERTYARLGDESSKRALIDVMKFRVLGPRHAPLQITPQAYRARQDYADRELRLQQGTFEVADPWFSPLSLYRVPVAGGAPITLHSHSVDIVSIFLLEQYLYGSRVVCPRPGDTVLDVGGWGGDTALYFARLVGPAGKVFTFEFDPQTLEVMRANLELNPELAARIEIVERALWDKSGEELAFVQAGRLTAVLAGDADPTKPRVTTVTVDDFVREAELDSLGFVKMDVEGAELAVLRGARDALARFGPQLAIAAYHREDDLVRISEVAASVPVGYRQFLRTSSPLEDETVLFATAENNST
jgi:FkbM family methyltransferase